MRDILFKGKRLDNGQWVEGSLINNLFVKSKDKSPICNIVSTEQIKEYCGYEPDNFEEMSEAIDYCVVDPETVCQYTGIDDCNGKKIFEGDEIECNNGHVGSVHWEKHDCCFNVSGYYCGSECFPTMAFIEGQPFNLTGRNIHDTKGEDNA